MNIIQIPFSGGGLGHGNGANEAPKKIVEQFDELFANESGESPQFNISSIELDEQNIGESHATIEDFASRVVEKSIFLGGDHSVTQPILKGLLKNYFRDKDVFFIVFDAHPDLMDDFRPPTQEDYLRVLIEEGSLKPENVLLLGLRNWDDEEVKYLEEKGIHFYSMKEIFDRGIKEVISEVKQILSGEKNKDKEIYLSLDIDVVDPVEAIGTGYLEHGGLSSRELIYAVQELASTKRLSAVDIVEVNPSKDIRDMTSKLAAKIIFELGEF